MEQGYAAFLLLGVVLVLIDGQLIYRSGKGYMNRAYGDPEAARSMTRLATVLFHLVVLGLLALVSMISINTGDPVKDVVAKLGIVLLVLALVHAVTMVVLGRIRDRQLQQQLADEMAEEHRQFEQQHRVPAQTRVEPLAHPTTTSPAATAPTATPMAPQPRVGQPAPTAEQQVDPTQVKTIR
jgi:Tfp pilus assembly protein PilX